MKELEKARDKFNELPKEIFDIDQHVSFNMGLKISDEPQAVLESMVLLSGNNDDPSS